MSKTPRVYSSNNASPYLSRYRILKHGLSRGGIALRLVVAYKRIPKETDVSESNTFHREGNLSWETMIDIHRNLPKKAGELPQKSWEFNKYAMGMIAGGTVNMINALSRACVAPKTSELSLDDIIEMATSYANEIGKTMLTMGMDEDGKIDVRAAYAWNPERQHYVDPEFMAIASKELDAKLESRTAAFNDIMSGRTKKAQSFDDLMSVRLEKKAKGESNVE